MRRVDRFQRAGLTFDVRDAGPSDGEVVVLLHGFPQSPAAFDAVVPLLHSRGLRTLAPWQRGYSRDARPTSRRAYATSETAADVLALLDAAGVTRAHLVGHDWGGAPAWALAAWHPERIASVTVLSTPHPGAMLSAVRHSTQGLKSWYMGFFQLPAVPELLVSRTLARTLADSGLPQRYVEEYVAALAEPGALAGALGWYRGIPFSRNPTVGRSRVPTTYVWGRRDFALGRPAAEATEQFVAAEYRFVELDAGHWLPETRPDDVAAAVLHRVGAA